VLIARNQSKLESLSQEFRKISPDSNPIILCLDLTQVSDVKTLCNKMKEDTSLGLLINNAGYGTIGGFADLKIEEELREIQLNVTTLVETTHAALQNFKQQKSGAIINVASIAGYLPAPYSATYAATKAYVRSFTESIFEELRDSGISIQALCPGLTHSDFHQRAGIEKSNFPNFMWMTAEEVVTASLLALKRNQVICIPGGVNQSAVGLTNLLPSSITRKVAGMLMKK
jgi:short-subunit dehydrogenase